MTAELPGRPHATARTPRSGPFVVATIGFVASEVFVGRRPEVAVLHDLLAGVKGGVGGVVLVAGEQGVGKSSLLRAGLGEAEGQECRVLWGAADELGQRIPLWLMGEVFAEVDGVSGDGLMGGDAALAGVRAAAGGGGPIVCGVAGGAGGRGFAVGG